MSKEDLLSSLNYIEDTLKKLNSDFSRSKVRFVARKDTIQRVQLATRKWFEETEPILSQFGVSDDIKKKYHNLFTQLLQLSLKTSRKSTYQKTVAQILNDFKGDVVVEVMKTADQIVSIANLAKILENVTPEEREYLNEALGCARHGFLRGSMVLVWSAAVHRMQRAVEKAGLNEFNKKSEEMKNISAGRFKRFSKSFNVHSLSELRATVFDTDLLWVLEYWGYIDANQHERLSICFTMRNNAAHPGEAPITEPNLASAFSDLKHIVFDNPRFRLG